MTLKSAILTGFLVFAASDAARAGYISYPTPGVENTFTYSFAATSSGDLSAYFLGSGASYDETLGVLINGVDSGIVGLDNHSSSLGEKLDFGPVTAGESLTFYIDVKTTGHDYYSDVSKNADGINHVYSTFYTADPSDVNLGAVPSGIYVGFEDLSPVFDGHSDFNYADESFVFTNTTAVSAVPLPASLSMLGSALLALAGLSFGVRRRAMVTRKKIEADT